MTLREVEIYIPNVEYRTCFYSSQESGETWWPSKCHEWTFGLKSGYQQVREVLKVHTCLPSAVGVSNISEIWVWYKVHFQFGGEARCFFRWTSVFLYFRLKNTWRVNAASIYYVDILITTNESHVSELSSGKELLWIIFPLLLKALFRRISSKEIMPDLPPRLLSRLDESRFAQISGRLWKIARIFVIWPGFFLWFSARSERRWAVCQMFTKSQKATITKT